MARSIRQHSQAKTIAVATTVNTRKHCYQVMTVSRIIRIFKCLESARAGRALLVLNHRFFFVCPHRRRVLWIQFT